MYYFFLISILLIFGTPSDGYYCLPCALTQTCSVPASCEPDAAPSMSQDQSPINFIFRRDSKDTPEKPEKERQPSPPVSRRFLTSLFAIPGAVADSMMSGEIHI